MTPRRAVKNIINLNETRAEECLAYGRAVGCGRRDADQMLGKVDGRTDSLAGKAMVEGKFLELVDGSLHKLRLGKAE